MTKKCIIQPGNRMLWVCYDGFGDLLQMLAYIKLFKDAYPKTHITILTSPIHEDIASQGYVDKVLTGNRGTYKKFHSVLSKIIKEPPFDYFVNLQNNRGETNLIGLLLRIPNKIGNGMSYFKYCYDTDFASWAETLETDLRDRNTPIPFSSSKDRVKAQEILKILPHKKIFAIIGAGYEQKMWPVENWCTFLKPLSEQGFGIVLNGYGQFEADFAKKIESYANSPYVLNLVGKLNFRQMAAVAAICDIAVGNDTGPLHLAAIQGTPTLGLFGGTSFANIGLIMPTFRVAYSTCPHILCGKMQECTFREKCLASITPEYVSKIFWQMVKNI